MYPTPPDLRTCVSSFLLSIPTISSPPLAFVFLPSRFRLPTIPSSLPSSYRPVLPLSRLSTILSSLRPTFLPSPPPTIPSSHRPLFTPEDPGPTIRTELSGNAYEPFIYSACFPTVSHPNRTIWIFQFARNN